MASSSDPVFTAVPTEAYFQSFALAVLLPQDMAARGAHLNGGFAPFCQLLTAEISTWILEIHHQTRICSARKHQRVPRSSAKFFPLRKH